MAHSSSGSGSDGNGVVGRFRRDAGAGRRLTLLWRNQMPSGGQSMRSRSFALGADALGSVKRIFVERATVFLAAADTLIHERSLLGLTVIGARNELVLVSDPAISSGAIQATTVSCTLAASGYMGPGNFCYTYKATDSGGCLIFDRSGLGCAEGGVSIADLGVELSWPLYPALDDTAILQVCLTLRLE